MLVKFTNIVDAKISDTFQEALAKYPILHAYQIELKQQKIKASTMQARPVFDLKSLLFGFSHYRITLNEQVRNQKELFVRDLPVSVLRGWFAHELGHIVDYLDRSPLAMLLYGLKYLLFSSFRRNAEWEADRIAIKYGFREDILATKRFILEHELLDHRYKERIRKYYMSIDEAEKYIMHNVPIDEVEDRLT